jgi:hypothetical protein
MKTKRHFLLNDRVKAMISLFIIMVLTILLVFTGIEGLKLIPTLTPEQQLYLKELTYPLYFKLLVVIVWGIVSILSAYLLLLYRYSGFINRLHHFFLDFAESDKGQNFHFRHNENTIIIQGSFESLLKLHRNQIQEKNNRLLELKQQLKERSMSGK